MATTAPPARAPASPLRLAPGHGPKGHDNQCMIFRQPKSSGLNLIVVLTFKKSVRSLRQAEELLREVSFRARTDCVYFIENYTWSNTGPNLLHPPVIKNDFGTHFTVLTIIRQCLEFIKLNRSQKDEKNPKQADTQADAKTAPKV
ncbi:hypothetical protein D1007_53149 [Hordeum vulgare]|nr:hypothetical protein D1007_53149 [Hordeum vulgare]KAI5008317.1 hypothetical protein ZWY2020_009365 [Hordeum vulgare]